MRVRPFLLCSSLTVAQMCRPCGAAAQAATGPHDAPHGLLSSRNAVAAGFLLAVAFMGDEGLRIEAQESRGADRSAVARVINDRHWTSDVLAGALVGHLSARWLSRRPGLVMVQPGRIGISLSF